MKKEFVLILVMICSLGASFAQKVDRLIGDDKLSSTLVRSVFMDSHGIMWIATQNGLNRYDGEKFFTYSHIQDLPTSLRNNYVHMLAQYRDDSLLIGTLTGLQIMDTKHSEFKDIPVEGNKESAHIACEAHNGNLWLLGSWGFGLYKLNDNNGKLSISNVPTLEGVHTIRSMACTDNGFAIATNQGIIFLDNNLKIEKTFSLREDEKGYSVAKDSIGNIYVGGSFGRIYQIPPSHDTLYIFADNDGNSPVCSILIKSNMMIVGADGDGTRMYFLNDKSHTPQRPKLNAINNDKAKIVSMVWDNNGNIWAACHQKGIEIIPKQKTPFRYIGHKSYSHNIIGEYCVLSVAADSSGKLFIGTDNDGIYILDSNLKTKHFETNTSTGQPIRPVKCMLPLDSNRLLVGCYLGGVWLLNTETGKMLPVNIGTPEYNTNRNTINSIARDLDGAIWIGGNYTNLIKLNPKNLTVEARLIGGELINNISVTSDNHLLVSTYSGLFEVNNDVSKIIDSMIIMSAVRQGRYIWATSTNSTIKINTQTNERTVVDIPELPQAITIGNDNNIHMSSHNGIFVISSDSTYTHYLQNDGLICKEFGENAVCTLSNGKICFGSTDGIVIYDPLTLTKFSQKPTIKIAEVLVHNIPFSGNMDPITLNYDENSFTIGFTAMEYINPEAIRYNYQTDSGEIIYLNDGQNSISFANLSYGLHTIKAWSYNHNQISDPITIKVRILRPWYKSYLAYTLYILLIVFGIFSYIRMMKYRYKTSLKVNSLVSQLREMEYQKKIASENTSKTEEPILPKIEMKSSDEKFLDKFMTIINENISNPNLSVDMICDEMLISRSQLYRKTKELTSLPASTFIKNIRLQQGAELLKQGKFNVQEIADKIGFGNAAYFSTAFKEAFGVSPKDYK